MPSILKRLKKTDTTDFVFQPVTELKPSPPPGKALKGADAPETDAEEASSGAETSGTEPAEPELSPAEEALRFAEVQAKAIVEDARREAEAIREQARIDAEAELQEQRRRAREEGYGAGFAEGMAQANEEGRLARERQAAELEDKVREFLEDAAREKAELLDSCKDEMKDMAVAIAEKVIRVSLRNSTDILMRMVDAATDTHKRCEWAHIYVADCDIKGKAKTIPELTAALSHLSDRVKVIPMADDESGTCIVELPDVILDASVSTQLGNIREVLSGVSADQEDAPMTFRYN